MSKKKDAVAIIAGASAGAVARGALGKGGLIIAGTGVSVGTLPYILAGAAVVSTSYSVYKLFKK